jgi:hypothetical protein
MFSCWTITCTITTRIFLKKSNPFVKFAIKTRTNSLKITFFFFCSPTWCRVLYLLFKYGRLSNYFWMLCEGIYLHQLIVQPFHQQKITVHFYLIGWITPLLVMIPFTLIHSSAEHNRNCWTDNASPYLEWLFLSLPIFCWLVSTSIDHK